MVMLTATRLVVLWLGLVGVIVLGLAFLYYWLRFWAWLWDRSYDHPRANADG
jgi:hypothetical protein